MEVDQDFAVQFYNLEGVHYNERKKNFAKLLNATAPEVLRQQLDIQPRNYLEKIFYVDILIRTRQVDKLVEVLKEGNGVLTSRILKQKWFFEEAVKNLSEAAIVNEFLPTLSHSLRMKVLKKMSLLFDEERMDNIFDHVAQRYGLFIGQQFLFSCSSSKIIDTLKSNKVTLSVEQLKRILDKDYSLVKIYFEEYKKNTGQAFDNYDFLSYIPWKYPNLYFEFQPYYQNHVKIGRQTTKTVLKINADEALKDVDKLHRKFNISSVIRKVRNFDKNYLSKNFPANINRIDTQTNWMTIANYLRKYPQKMRWEAFSRAFTHTYNEDPINHLKSISENVVELFPSDIKRKWSEIQFHETNKFRYIKFFDAQKAFVLVKEKINVTSDVYERASMLMELIKTCHTNKSYGTYEEVLKYIVARHRNEDNSLRTQVMGEISRNIDYELTTETFWNCVNQLIDVFRIKGEGLPWNNIFQYLIFAVKRNLPLDEPVAQHVQDVSNAGDYWQFWNIGKELKCQGVIMRIAMKFLHQIGKESNRESLAISLMGLIVDFNEKQPDLVIDLNESPVIVELVRKTVGKDRISTVPEYTCMKHLVQNNYSKKYQKPLKVCEESKLLDLIKTTKNDLDKFDFAYLDAMKRPRTTEFQNGLLDFYFTRYLRGGVGYFGRQKVLTHFMAEEPQVIAKYSEQVCSSEAHCSFLDYSVVKLYSHLALNEKFVAYCKPRVTVSSTKTTKTNLIAILSKLMSTDDFVCLIQEYVPQKWKLNMEDSEQKKLYEAQCAIAKSLKNLDEYVKLIPLLSSFCQGDYLQSSLPVLYKVLYNVNEQRVISVIDLLIQRAVSVRKHAVFLSFEVLPQSNSVDVFNTVLVKETEVSTKKYIFRALLKYFLKNPSELFLRKVLENITFVHKNDQESLQNLVNSINKVPVKSRPTFVEQLWKYLDDIERQEVNVLQYKTTLLSTINSYEVKFFSALEESFSQNVVTNYFFSNQDFMLRNGTAYDFAAKYLLSHKDEQHFKFLFDILQAYKNLHWKSDKPDKLGFIFQFFEQVYKKYIRDDTEFLNLFKMYWEQVFTIEESFTEYVLLRLMVLHKESTNIGVFAKNVAKTLEEITLEYGPYTNNMLVNCIKIFFSIDGLANDPVYNKLSFALELLDTKTEMICFIAAELAAPYRDGDDEDNKYLQVINALRTVESVAVKIRYNCLLKRSVDHALNTCDMNWS